MWIWNWSGAFLIKAILVGLDQGDLDFEASMEETKALMEAADLECLYSLFQKARNNTTHYVKSGKLLEVQLAMQSMEVDLLITNDALSPSQHRNLSEALNVEVWDRTQLILAIFGSRAQDRASKLQVEVARLSYLLPRMSLTHHSSGREQGGGARNRGSGEQALALAKRVTLRQLHKAESELKELEAQREVQARLRQRNAIFTIALVGYTNAGKSTLMNRLNQKFGKDIKEVRANDRLFESLSPSARYGEIDGIPVLFLDTVGFVSRLPHSLVKAFHSTLKVVQEADLIIHVNDASSTNWYLEKEVTLQTLNELEVLDKPRIEVNNKMDLGPCSGLCISAREGTNCELLYEKIKAKMLEIRPLMELFVPYDQNEVLDSIKAHYTIQAIVEEDAGYRIQLKYHPNLKAEHRAFERSSYDHHHIPKH